MAITAQQARDLALSLEGASAAPHFDRTAFRTPRRIFATLGPDGTDLNLMFDPDLRDHYCEQDPEAFAPVAGGWGRMGATCCWLDRVDPAIFLSALTAAHARASAPPPARSRRTGPARR